MKTTENRIFLIDFDSTFITHEGLDEFAEIVLEGNKNKDKILEQFKNITKQGMEGALPFNESLKKRVKLLKANRSQIERVVKKLKRDITPSIHRNKKFFTDYKNRIYVISGGFKEFIIPVVTQLGIDESHVFANNFTYDKLGMITGFDKTNVLATENGKTKLIKSLNLKGDLYVIGDGVTDYQIKEAGLAKKFIAFTENASRIQIIKKADHIAPTFDEFLYMNNLPMSVSYPKSRIKVVLFENIDNDAVLLFEKEGYQVEYHQKSYSGDELVSKINNTHIIGIRSRTEVSKEIIEKNNKLMAIGAYCIGTDQIQINKTLDNGIAVFNAPYSNTRSVVELVIGEIIILTRGVVEKNNKLHNGIWDKSAQGSHEIREKTLGIIGYGNIGSQLSVLAESLGMNVIFYDLVDKLALGNAKRCKNLAELLKKSDIVTLHIDGRQANADFISDKEFALMKNGSLFLNLSRGKMVNINALAKTLKHGNLAGAAIDVFPKEPKNKDEVFLSPLQGLPNVILTPHIGGSTLEAQKNIAKYVTSKIIDYVNSGNTYLNVSLPSIQPPDVKNYHRLLHLHKNTPGVLAKINNILAKNDMNILGQYLKTENNVGYVITDVNKKYNKDVLDALKTIPETIRFRVLY